jgi:SAM-dependent methyltransferase
MPTLPPAGANPPENEPHQHRQVAESFGSDAERYDRTRPRYPDALVDRIVAGSPGPDVLDVGCGTGIAARQFRAAGCTVLGVEPDARMADFARRSGIDVEVATIETWDPAGRSFDTVVAAQTWHWVEPVAGAAKVAQVLRPGGRFAAFWNVAQPPAEATEAFGAVYQRVAPEALAARAYRPKQPAPEGYSNLLAKVIDGIRQTGGFGEPEQWQFDWEQPYTREQWLDVLPTQGGLSQLPPAQLAELLAGMGAAMDAIGGSFTMSYSASVLTAVRTGAR